MIGETRLDLLFGWQPLHRIRNHEPLADHCEFSTQPFVPAVKRKVPRASLPWRLLLIDADLLVAVSE